MSILAKRIKYLRESLKDKDSKWTQGYVAEKIGVARVTYTAYENDTKTPPPDVIIHIADLFNVSSDYILGRTSEKQPISDMTEDEIDIELKELMSEMNVWFKDEPEDKKEKLRMLRKAFRIVSED